jgi:hypothetical protein
MKEDSCGWKCRVDEGNGKLWEVDEGSGEDRRKKILMFV